MGRSNATCSLVYTNDNSTRKVASHYPPRFARDSNHVVISRWALTNVSTFSPPKHSSKWPTTLEKVRRGEVDRTQQRALAASAVEVTIDAQGRINIDEKLRAYAGLTLDSKVVISGSFDRCEIWDPTRHQRVSEAGTAQMAGGAS